MRSGGRENPFLMLEVLTQVLLQINPSSLPTIDMKQKREKQRISIHILRPDFQYNRRYGKFNHPSVQEIGQPTEHQAWFP